MPAQWKEAPSRSTRYRKPGQVVTIYDPVQDKWDTAPSLPTGFRFDSRDSRCVSVNHKLVFMGLYKQDTDMLTKAVLIYDFSSSLWKHGSDMPVFHSSFACAVSLHDGLIYIAGGSYGCKNAMCYNVEKDKWEILPEIQQDMIKCRGFFLRCYKFYVISRWNCDIEMFDTHTRVWTTLKDMWKSRWFPDFCVAAFGCLYYFEDGVREYDWKENVWRRTDHFPSMWEYVPYGGTIWKDKIFVRGYETESGKEKYYMFQPSKSGTLFSERWTAIERPIDIHDHVMVAVNLKVLLFRYL